MDLLKACDEAKAVIHSAMLVVDAWRQDPDNYSALEQALTELESELKRIEEDK